jgi:subtilase family serine protease
MGKAHNPRARISRRARKRVLLCGTSLTAVAVVVAVGATEANATPPAAISHAPAAVGFMAPVPAGAQQAAAPADSTGVDVDVALQPRDAARLARYAEEVSDPGSPYYKQYLTKAQTQQLFAPAQSTVDAVSAALRTAGLNPGPATDDNLFIPVKATIGQLKQAFKIGFAGYRLRDGSNAFNATSVPMLDQSVAADVRGVVGLDDFIKPSTNRHSRGKTTRATSAADLRASAAREHSGFVPSLCSGFSTAVATWLAQYNVPATDGGTYYSPTAMATAYGYAKQLNSGDLGQGVTVAVEEWESVDQTAVTDYLNCIGAHNNVTYNTSRAANAIQPSATNGIGGEASLDIESLASIAPEASIIDYEGPDITATFTDADWLRTFAAPVADDSAKVISLSWGTCENPTFNATMENGESLTLSLAAVQGQSFFADAGDNGSEDCNNMGQANPMVDAGDPVSIPFITAVGGTSMQGINDPDISVWNNSAGATGGGVSMWWTLPAGAGNYQAGFTGPGYANICHASGGATCRETPDIAALGDPDTGFPQLSYADNSTAYVSITGGTSLATPVMAGITALADSSSKCARSGPAGFINPTLYDLAKNPQTYAKDFVDLTTGNNAFTPSGYKGSLYKAAKGYDMASGLGSPRAQNLIPALCAANKHPSKLQ